ncbi:MAG: exosortase-associated EpsI family protein [Verrucomicrobiales bacterium]|nr:exosortase-associated EpsI family protein [Verrucomicrobiales bacterium]
MTRRLALLLTVLVAGFSSIWLLPRSYAIHLSALPGSTVSNPEQWELPGLVGTWQAGERQAASEKEREVLAKDTNFNKRSYLRPGINLKDSNPNHGWEEIDVSIVTSGSDMGNSIHRPERCLAAQGFNILKQESVTLAVRGKPMNVRKLLCSKTWQDPQSGASGVFHNVTYYWFVGHESVTDSHWSRTFVDMKDRLMRGFDQQWAYASVSLLLDPHPVMLKSKYERMRESLSRRVANGRMSPEDSRVVLGFLKRLDDSFPTHPDPEKDRVIADAEAGVIREFLDEPKRSQSVRDLFSEVEIRRSEDVRGATRPIDEGQTDASGLTEADRLLRPFIADLAAEIIDRRMISAWNQPNKN